ncbi:unnamed protein product, partial [Timema podura]|nr:unnamed protein product [Timema podura]
MSPLTGLKNEKIKINFVIKLRRLPLNLPLSSQVKFVMDEKTTLSDLLALNLHNYEDEVKNIVDKSVKEMSMEKVLKELHATWSTMEFDHEVHHRTNLTVLRASEELIEILEENQVQLQNLMSSKYISFFLDEVSDWQKKLANADQVIQIWFEVQRTWMHLESIFIGSEDIQRKFTGGSIATNKPHLYERLENIQKDLTLCEKALTEYLETKRLAYPRFYFMSVPDLLDILSNGNQPVLVARHLSKLYDSMCKLKFRVVDGRTTKLAEGMYERDGEYVEFFGECECTGKVEVWLNRLTDTMRRTVRHYLGDAVVTYEERSRESWVFDYPSQIALCGTQIWWATEVSIAFARLEEGYELAVRDYQRKQ